MDTLPLPMGASPIDYPPFKNLSANGFTPYFHIWRWCGIWPLPGDRNIYKIYSVFVQFFGFILFNLSMFLMVPSSESLDDVMEVLMPLTATMLASIQSKLILINRESIRKFFITAKQLENTIEDNVWEKAVLVNSTRQTRNLLMSVLACCFGTISFRFVQSMMADKRRLMWRAWMPFDWETPDSNWPGIGASLFLLLGNCYIGCVFSTFIPIATYLYGLLEANFDILANRLRHIADDDNGSNKEVERKLIFCVECHVQCLKLKKILFDIFGVALFVQFTFNSLVICVTCYQLSVVSINDTAKVTFLIIYLVNMIVQILIPCFFGSLIRASSERFGIAPFQSKWYDQPLRFQRMIMMVIAGGQQTIVLNTYLGWFDIALPTFVTVCRAAYSLLSCLKA